MNDDWDGVDWAESFSGPDDDDIQRLREREWQDMLEREPDDDVRAAIPEQCERPHEVVDSGYIYSSYQVASDRAGGRNSLSSTGFRVEAVKDGWVLKSTPVPEVDRLAEEQSDLESKLSLGAALIYSLQIADRAYALQLLERPTDVNVRGNTGSTPLMVAAQRGYADVCERLLSLGATFQTEIGMPTDPNQYDSNERADTVMQRALRSRDWPTIEVISKVYVSAEWTWMKENMPQSDLPYWGYPRLVDAARYGMTALCAEMIGRGVDTKGDSPSVGDEPPIEAAFSNDQISTCIVLAAMGADISPLRAMDGFTDELEAAFTTIRKYCKTQPS
jgi:hypothetical protein